MIRVIITMRIREGAAEEFERAWERMAPSVAAVPGNLQQELLRDAKDPRRYLVTSDWESEDALGAFSASGMRAAFSAELEPLRESAERTVHELVHRREAQRP